MEAKIHHRNKKKYNKNLLLKDKENTNAAASYCTVVSR